LRRATIISHELVAGSVVIAMVRYVIQHELYYRNELWNLDLSGL
jgi:hypothetical protein